eukprot:m.45555 g.45555  ORF g.45555 m.45555 type:complete len:341 (-) comp8653_c0_seq1:3544-4566(-)
MAGRSALASYANIVERLVAGDRGGLARAITLSESTNGQKRAVGQRLISEALRCNRERELRTGKRTFRVGISGPPGAGKSTLIEAMGRVLTDQGRRVAVLSIDPSSSVTGGSILGDKTRMPELSHNPLAYVRPSPSSGTLGGVARSTCDSVVLCEAAGYDTVLVETVGVGQSETAVADMVDMYVLVVPPAGGDVLQGLKRGIVELVDLVLVNKADGDLLPAARRAKREYLSALKLLRHKSELWSPPVQTVSALTGDDVDEALGLMHEYHTVMEDGGELATKRRNQSKLWLWTHVTDRLTSRFKESAHVRDQIDSIQHKVETGELTAGQGADFLLSAAFDEH